MRLLVVVVVLVLSMQVRAQEAPHSDAASESLVHGVDAFKAGHYEEATRDFQSAVDADPGWNVARLYLGTALAYQVIPNLDTPENVAMANRALEQFDKLLASDPNNLSALRQVASIQRNIKQFDESLATERKIIAIDPTDAEAHYTIGVIEWTSAYKIAVQTLANESLQDDGNGNVKLSAAGCASLVANNTALVEDGIAELKRAIEIRPTYDDAMLYLNLMYRRRADLECHDPERRKQDLDAANEWVRRALEARRAIEQQKMQQAHDSSIK